MITQQLQSVIVTSPGVYNFHHIQFFALYLCYFVGARIFFPRKLLFWSKNPISCALKFNPCQCVCSCRWKIAGALNEHWAYTYTNNKKLSDLYFELNSITPVIMQLQRCGRTMTSVLYSVILRWDGRVCCLWNTHFLY